MGREGEWLEQVIPPRSAGTNLMRVSGLRVSYRQFALICGYLRLIADNLEKSRRAASGRGSNRVKLVKPKKDAKRTNKHDKERKSTNSTPKNIFAGFADFC
jgi:hypothetical protein